MEVTLDGERLSAAEIKRLLAHSDGLALIRGKREHPQPRNYQCQYADW
jgi:hypothetical protein